MLSEREKRELLEMAASARIREDSSRLRAASRAQRPQDVDFAAALEFLTAIARLSPALPPRRPPERYPRPLL